MQRIKYIDSMRGFAMFLVVVAHVMLRMYPNQECDNGYYMSVNVLIQIPLFFMISGYFCDKAQKVFSFKQAIIDAKRKVAALILAPIIFGLIYCWVNNIPLEEAIFSKFKSGYWFTFSLFEFIIIYYISWIVIKLLRLSDKWSLSILMLSAIIIFFCGRWCIHHQDKYRLINLGGGTHLIDYVYFILGIICHRFMVQTSKIMDKRQIIGGCIVFTLIGVIYTYSGVPTRTMSEMKFTIFHLILSVSALFVVFATFRHYPQLSTNSAPGRCLNFIGRRTLDVYFLHYFFLPNNLEVIGEWANKTNNPFLIYIATIVIGLVVVGATLALGAVIRISPTLAKLLGGK